MRRGILKETSQAFEEAITMCGCMHPDEMDRERERLTLLRDEVMHILRAQRALDERRDAVRRVEVRQGDHVVSIRPRRDECDSGIVADARRKQARVAWDSGVSTWVGVRDVEVIDPRDAEGRLAEVERRHALAYSARGARRA